MGHKIAGEGPVSMWGWGSRTQKVGGASKYPSMAEVPMPREFGVAVRPYLLAALVSLSFLGTGISRHSGHWKFAPRAFSVIGAQSLFCSLFLLSLLGSSWGAAGKHGGCRQAGCRWGVGGYCDIESKVPYEWRCVQQCPISSARLSKNQGLGHWKPCESPGQAHRKNH